MRDIAVIDCETDPFMIGRLPKPFLWGYYNGSEYHQFSDTRKLAAFIAEREEIVYAHNGGKFDFHYLLPYLNAFDELTIINGRLARATLGACELRDSFCIVPTALSAYKKDDIDYRIMEVGERDKPANKRKIAEYMRNDCVYLWEMVTAFIDRFGPELTLAGAAMKQWIKISNTTPEATDRWFYDEFAPYYYGGRVQCFRGGVVDTNFSVYDINSAYPRAMLEPHPYSANYERSNRLLRNADFVRVRCRSGGGLPFRGMGGGGDNDAAGLWFPADDVDREYTISKWEFDAAEDTNSIRRTKVLESVRFCKHQDFSAYIDKFWQERKSAKLRDDVLESLFCKLMMNSLYGKFAANPENYNHFMIVDHEPKYVEALAAGTHDGWEFGGELGPWLLAQKALSDFERRYYNVATGASITGYVRAMLWRAISGSEGVLYCDTDSIAVQQRGRGVVLGDGLGQWKHEGNFDRAGIGGKKLYIFRGVPGSGENSKGRTYKTASKGARLTDAQLWEVARGGRVYYESEAPTFSAKKAPTFTNRIIVNTARAT